MPAMKRPAAASAKAQSAKIAKVGATAASPKEVAPPPPPTKCDIVVNAIREYGDLPAECRDMLAAAFPSCLEQTRHTIQESMVAMVEEVLRAQESSAQSLVDAAEAEAADVEKRKEAQEQALAEAKASAEAAQQASAAKATDVAQATEALESAKAASSAATRAHTAHAEKLQTLLAQKAALKELMEAKFTALKDGSLTGEVGTEINSLVSEGTKLGFDAGLMASVPSALSKPPEARGQFDQMVIDQVATVIQEKQARIQEVLANGYSEAERLQTSVVQAKQAQADAFEEQGARVSALEVAKEDAANAAEALSEASKAATEVGAAAILFAAEIQARKKLLEDFLAGPYAAFKELRDGPKASAQVPEEKVDEPVALVTAEEEDTKGSGQVPEEKVDEPAALVIAEEEDRAALGPAVADTAVAVST